MKSSARNQFSGTIRQVHIGSVNAEVDIELNGGMQLVAAVTKESAQQLGLNIGSQVIALVKASQMILVTDFAGYQLSARNQLNGTIAAITTGQVNSEIILALNDDESLQLAVTVTNDSVQTLGLAKGKSATAVFKANAVILAIPT
jgi:molybdate transport system regulatory protein